MSTRPSRGNQRHNNYETADQNTIPGASPGPSSLKQDTIPGASPGPSSLKQDTIPGASPGPSSLKGVRRTALVHWTNGFGSPPRYVHVAEEDGVCPGAEFVAFGFVLHRIADGLAQLGFIIRVFA